MNLSTSTIRDLALVAVLIADVAWDGAKDAFARLRPYIEPPPDLRVHSTAGGIYTGILLVDKNEILAGVVIRTGHAQRSTPTHERPSGLDTSSWRSPLVDRFEDEGDAKLPGWGEDPRDRSDRWRR